MAATYTLGGLTGSVSGDSTYGWDGSKNTAFRAALQNSANFGPGGTVPTSIVTVDISDTSSLGSIKGLVIPWWANSSASTTQINQVFAFFQAGGDLFIGQDDTGHTPMGTKIGVPTVGVAGSAWTPSGAFNSGPFGAPGSVTAFFNIGTLSAANISSLSGTVGSTDGTSPTSAYFPKGAVCPTCGSLVVIADIDTWATGPVYSPLNANAKFALNAVAYLINNSGNFVGGPPSPPSTPVPPSVWMALIGLVCSGIYFAYRNRSATH